MDLSILSKKESSKESEYYWSLVIEPGWVQAGIWRITDSHAAVEVSGVPTPWELEDDLVEACDTALSSAIQQFPEEKGDPSKTVFGLVSSWISGGQIRPEYLAKIQKVCEELSLTPVGFVVLAEAISHLYKSDEGTPLSALVLGVYSQSIEISFFASGNQIGTTQVARSVSVAEDLVEGLARMRLDESLPPRIILFDGKGGELEDVRQAIISTEWDKFDGVNFNHPPKVEITESHKKVYAVCLAGASEIASINKIALPHKDSEVADKDYTDVNINENDVVPIGKDEMESLGFAVDSEVPDEGDYPEVENTNKSPGKLPFLLPVFAPLKNILNKVKDIFSKRGSRVGESSVSYSGSKKRLSINLSNLAMGKKMFAIGGILLLLLLIGGFLAWWYVPKATVTLYLSPQNLEERISVVVDPSASSVDVSAGVVPAKVLSTTVSGEKTKSTTGVKTVGEKAKGKVTFYRVGTSLSLPSGTIMSGPGNLRFSLDSQVTVASGSASTPGQADGSVTAEDIGSEYNLAGNTNFTVGNYSNSDIEAKNSESFSGGTSREISVVSEDDHDDLLQSLEEELIQNAVKELTGELESGQEYIEGSASVVDSTENYSHDIDDETSSVKLSLSQDVQILVADKGTLVELANSLLEEKVPDGYTLRPDQVDVDFELKGQNEDDLYEFEILVKANLLPEIKSEEIVESVAGKYPEVAVEYFKKEVPGFSEAFVVLSPRLPGRLRTLPHVPKNITLEIAASR